MPIYGEIWWAYSFINFNHDLNLKQETQGSVCHLVMIKMTILEPPLNFNLSVFGIVGNMVLRGFQLRTNTVLMYFT